MAWVCVRSKQHRFHGTDISLDVPHVPSVLFMTGNGGAGHRAAAVALRHCLLNQCPSSPTEQHPVRLLNAAEIIDEGLHGQLLPSGDDVYNYFMQYGWYYTAGLLGYVASWSIRQSGETIGSIFDEFFLHEQPVLVVSFVPFLNSLMRKSLLRTCPTCQLVTLVTDMSNSSAHTWIDPWDDTATNHTYVVGNSQLESQARELGYSDSSIWRTSGMVVHPCFYEKEPVSADSIQAGSPTIVVFFGGCAPMRAGNIAIQACKKHPDCSVVLVCGGNQALFEQMQGEVETIQKRCNVEGFIGATNIRKHFHDAICVLGKPGPGVVAEAAVCQVPVVIERDGVMPQEQSVVDWIESNGTGIIVDNLENLPPDLLPRLEGCQSAFSSHPQNRAVFEVADFLKTLL